jgi:hypothetical protein
MVPSVPPIWIVIFLTWRWWRFARRWFISVTSFFLLAEELRQKPRTAANRLGLVFGIKVQASASASVDQHHPFAPVPSWAVPGFSFLRWWVKRKTGRSGRARQVGHWGTLPTAPAKARTDRKRTVPTFVLVETASARVYLAYCGSALLA